MATDTQTAHWITKQTPAIRDAVRYLAREHVGELTGLDNYDISDPLFETTKQHEDWAANKALEASNSTTEIEVVRDALEDLVGRLFAHIDDFLGLPAKS
jgi:hypothetical protein